MLIRPAIWYWIFGLPFIRITGYSDYRLFGMNLNPVHPSLMLIIIIIITIIGKLCAGYHLCESASVEERIDL